MESHSSTRLVVVAALCLLVLLVTSTQAGAQPQPAQAEPGDTRLQVGVQGLVGVALGDFSDNVDTTGGVNVDFTYALSGSSFRIGGGVGVLLYDRGTWLSDVSTLPAEWRFRHQRQSVSFGKSASHTSRSANVAILWGSVRNSTPRDTSVSCVFWISSVAK